MESIRIVNSKFGNKALAYLVKCYLPKLNSLRIQGKTITSEGAMKMISQAQFFNLRLLGLSRNNISCELIKEIPLKSSLSKLEVVMFPFGQGIGQWRARDLCKAYLGRNYNNGNRMKLIGEHTGDNQSFAFELEWIFFISQKAEQL